MGHSKITIGAVVVALLVSGCDLAGLTIKGTIAATNQFTEDKGGEFADPKNLRGVLESATITIEGANYFVDDHEPLYMSSIIVNVGYALLFLANDAKELEDLGKFDEAERMNKRAGILYARALHYTKKMLRLRDNDFDKAVAGGSEVFEGWVDETFFREDDAQVLMTAGIGYLVSMIESEDGLAAAVDLPYARYMIEKSIMLDDEVMGGLGYMMIGMMECLMPEMLGGRPHLGHRLMERASQVTDRENHSVLVAWAERCAVATQDKKLFHSLLMEVVESKDVPEYRMGNKLARHQAERLLKNIDELFYD